MHKLQIGSRVRYIGQDYPFANIMLCILVNRTGAIRARSKVCGADWFVVMDEGAYDLDAASEALVPIGEDEADNWDCGFVDAEDELLAA